MKITKILLIAGIASIMLSTTAFATEVESDTEIETNSQIEIQSETEIETDSQIETQSETEEVPENRKGMVTVDILNVRSEPSTETKKLGQLSLGTSIEILSETDGWYEINFESNTAYICAEYVRFRKCRG